MDEAVDEAEDEAEEGSTFEDQAINEEHRLLNLFACSQGDATEEQIALLEPSEDGETALPDQGSLE